MRPTGATTTTTTSARALLGAEHPLVRVLDALDEVARRLVAVATVLGVSLVATAAGIAFAPEIAVGAALVLLGLATAGALHRERRRQHARALVAAGREDLPVPAIERERARLMSRRTRLRLAAGFEDLVADAAAPELAPGPRPFDRCLVGTVATELRELATLLRDEPARARGIALAGRLLCDGESPLHGRDPAALREELGRVLFLLKTAADEHTVPVTGCASRSDPAPRSGNRSPTTRSGRAP
jgi:hypothetical protein